MKCTNLFRVIFILCAFIICGSAYAQRPCQTDQRHKDRLIRDVEYRKWFESLENRFPNNANRSSSIPCDGNNSVVIPVAIHFDAAYDCSNTSCILEAVDAQIAALNEDFAATNADLQSYLDLQVNTCGAPNVASTGTCISFCVADQNHPAASGIPDGQPAITLGEYNGSPANIWAGYLNIFIIDGLGFGVADAIGGAANGDGVSQDGAFFGGPGFAPCSSGGTLNDDAEWNLGRTLTHEVGHYLGLYHTFQGGCGDEPQAPYSVLDTPPQSNSSAGCPAATCANVASGCNPGEYVQYNFMDYFDDACLVMFSEDQAQAMNDHANLLNWAPNTGCAVGATSLAACQLISNFSPADGSTLLVCLDDGGSVDFIDLSTNGPVSWDWSFSANSGDLVFNPTTSTTQNPSLTFTGGTAGSISVTLEVCDASGTCETSSNTYDVQLLTGDACPNTCDFILNLTDDFGDGWNGATLEVFDNGVSVGIFGEAFTDGAEDGPYTVSLTDCSSISFVQTNGGFPGEEGWSITDPQGTIVASVTDGAPQNQTISASCNPGCDNGKMDGDETGIDCGGANCEPCPVCPDGYEEEFNEDFEGCAIPAGWTTTHTDAAGNTIGTCGDDVSGFSFDCVNGFPDFVGAGPAAGFAGCQAVFNDDNLGDGGPIGIACIVSPMMDLSACESAILNYDWQHEQFGGSSFFVEIFDGSAWVNILSSFINDNGAESTDVTAQVSAGFQVRFCYDDANDWEWGFAIDNVSVCCIQEECPDLTASAPAAEIIQESACTDFCNLTGGELAEPTTTCPDGSSLEYSTDGTNWDAVLPMYDQENSITVTTRCVCDTDNSVTSGITETITTPGPACETPAEPAGITITDSTCDPATMISSGGSFNGLETSCVTGTIQYYEDINITTPLNGAPSYNQAGPSQIFYVTCLDEASGCESPIFIVGPTFPGECADIVYSVDLDGTDPCDCNDDQSANGAGDGTFSELVSITTDPPTAGLSLCVANGSLGITAGTPLTDNGDGSYSVAFNHIDAIGFSLSVADCTDLDTPLVGPFSNVCYYPVIEENIENSYCETDAPIDLSALVSEAAGVGDFMGTFAFVGTGVSGSTFDPASVGQGTYTINITYTPTAVVGTNVGTIADCITELEVEIVVVDCLACNATHGTIDIQPSGGN